LEELYKIGMLKVNKKPFHSVKRKCRIICTENTKLLYMTAASFYKLFGELELKKVEPYLVPVNNSEIKRVIRLAWAAKAS
jgi:type IV secretory pathway component VirB8